MSSTETYKPIRTHYGSLLPVTEHNADLVWLMRQPVTEQMKKCIVARTCEVVDLECDTSRSAQGLSPAHSSLPSPPVTPTKPGFELNRGDDTPAGNLPTLEKFLDTLVNMSRIQVPTLLCTLIYLDRIKPCIPPVSSDTASKTRMPDTRHRVLLATIICAAKYLNDSSPKNKHWAAYSSSLFHCEEVNLMEQQLLCLLNWDLRFTEEDCIRTFSAFFKSSATRASYQPPTPSYEEACKPQTNSRLHTPTERRASRPARINISGPSHLHSSYSCSGIVGGAPLSPPPSGNRVSFAGLQAPPYVQHIDQPRKEDREEARLTSGTTGQYPTQGASDHLDQDSRSSYISKPRYARTGSWSRRDDAPSNPDTPREALSSTPSWPTLSVRAGGFLERVWGGSSHSGRGFKASRSVGGIFRANQSESAGAGSRV